MDMLLLSRIQFGLTITFHYIFPPMSIGLGLLLVIIEGMYMKTKKQEYKQLAKFWTKIFALFFAVGVASGFVQVFAFGNNWARFSSFVGNVFGSVLAAEGVFAFFLEAGFIGLMLFGWERVKPITHYISTILVAVGAHFSAIWIVIANSWMQTPAGFQVVGEGADKRAVVTDIWQVFLNPSSLDRITHVLLGCWILGSFLFISVGAYYLLKNRSKQFAWISLKIGIVIAFITLILQLISADSTARGVSENNPEKFAALEGVYKTQTATPMNIIGWVDNEKQEVKSLQVPGLLSFLTYRNTTTAVPGLDQFPKSDWPNVAYVFQFYHIMIYCWGAMMLIAIIGVVLWLRKRLENARWFLWIMVFSILLPYGANMTGWFTAEMGRQPWVVYGVLRTGAATSRSVSGDQVMGSIIMFICMYLLLFALFIFLLNRKIKSGPEQMGDEDALYTDPKLSV